MARINIEISKHGAVTAEANGFKDRTCVGPVDKLLSNLGIDPSTVNKEFKPEAFDTEDVSDAAAG